MIVSRLLELNQKIQEDPNLGRGFAVGHSYFCDIPSSEDGHQWYERVIQTEIAPLLREYWFDDRERADEEAKNLLRME